MAIQAARDKSRRMSGSPVLTHFPVNQPGVEGGTFRAEAAEEAETFHGEYRPALYPVGANQLLNDGVMAPLSSDRGNGRGAVAILRAATPCLIVDRLTRAIIDQLPNLPQRSGYTEICARLGGRAKKLAK